jgi:cytochrome c556
MEQVYWDLIILILGMAMGYVVVSLRYQKFKEAVKKLGATVEEVNNAMIDINSALEDDKVTDEEMKEIWRHMTEFVKDAKALKDAVLAIFI